MCIRTVRKFVLGWLIGILICMSIGWSVEWIGRDYDYEVFNRYTEGGYRIMGKPAYMDLEITLNPYLDLSDDIRKKLGDSWTNLSTKYEDGIVGVDFEDFKTAFMVIVWSPEYYPSAVKYRVYLYQGDENLYDRDFKNNENKLLLETGDMGVDRYYLMVDDLSFDDVNQVWVEVEFENGRIFKSQPIVIKDLRRVLSDV